MMREHAPVSARSFEAFNARFLSPADVARTFIPPAQYFRLCEVNHSVLYGPRGSGKTTLLKMLQLRSLRSWEHPDAEEVRNSLPFQSVFLGTDVLWGSQLEAASRNIKNEDRKAQIRRTSFRLHLSLALLSSINEARDEGILTCESLSRFHLAIDRLAEADLARSLASIWKVELTSNSLLGLRVALRSQLTDLYAVADTYRSGAEETVPPYTLLDPIVPIIGAVDVINGHFGQEERKWAILCDELEIAPEMIRHELFRLLRSTHQNVVFKFSLFPHTDELIELAGPTAPAIGQDFEALDLSYGYREAAYPFCEELLMGMVEQETGDRVTDVSVILGDGWFDGGRGSKRVHDSPLRAPHGKNFKTAKKLQRQDRSFVKWLDTKRFELEKVGSLPEPVQAQFRKAMPFILTRAEFLAPGGGRRSRKASTLYTGTYSLFSVSEGNPRIFINLMKPLVREYAERRAVIPEAVQAMSIDRTVHRYKASLSAIPTVGWSDIQSIMQLVDVVGTYLQGEQLGPSFRPEPASTILVDDDVPLDLHELIGRAINAGVFVRMPEERGAPSVKGGLATALRGSRLRLSYTLAPSYKLALVAGRSVRLSTILHARQAARMRRPELVSQYSLRFEEE